MEEIEIIKDIKKETAFWMDVLKNEHTSPETKKLADEILKRELQNHIEGPFKF